jgi:hypothetical protein
MSPRRCSSTWHSLNGLAQGALLSLLPAAGAAEDEGADPAIKHNPGALVPIAYPWSAPQPVPKNIDLDGDGVKDTLYYSIWMIARGICGTPPFFGSCDAWRQTTYYLSTAGDEVRWAYSSQGLGFDAGVIPIMNDARFVWRSPNSYQRSVYTPIFLSPPSNGESPTLNGDYIGFALPKTGGYLYGWLNLKTSSWAIETRLNTPIAMGSVVPVPVQPLRVLSFQSSPVGLDRISCSVVFEGPLNDSFHLQMSEDLATWTVTPAPVITVLNGSRSFQLEVSPVPKQLFFRVRRRP